VPQKPRLLDEIRQEAQSLSIEQLMTPSQLQETGAATLSGAQRTALNRRLNDYTVRVLQVASGTTQARGEYAGVGSRHWIKKVSSGGRVVELEDGSLWEINAVDRIDTAFWLPVTNISVSLAKTTVGEYKYTLLNKDDGETALAKYLGK
jgi:hypothetical protein